MVRRPPPAFIPATLFGVLPNGSVALSFTSGYTVRIVDLQGQTLRYLQRPVRTRLTTDRDREQAREAAPRTDGQRARAHRHQHRGRRRRSVLRAAAGRGRSCSAMMGEMEFMDTIPALQADCGCRPPASCWWSGTGHATWAIRVPWT